MAAFSAGTGGALSVRNVQAYPSSGGLSGAGITQVTVEGEDYLLPLGREIGTAYGYGVNGSGGLDVPVSLDPQGRLLASASGAVTAAFGIDGISGAQLVTASGSGLYSWRLTGSGAAQADHLAPEGGQISDIVQAADGVIVTADSTGDALRSYTVADSGALTAQDSYSAAEGGGINAPAALEQLRAGGADFTVAASSGSSSLTVLRTGSDGALIVADHLIDTGHSYFGGVAHLASAGYGSWNILAAAGSDGGGSLFALLPGGLLSPLVHAAWPARPGATAATGALSGFDAYVQDDALHVYAAPEGALGLHRVSLDLSGLGGVFSQEDAGADMAGTAGDDILVARASGQTLEGGAGADTIIFTENLADGTGRLGAIADFTPGEDRIDLTGLPLLRNPDQVVIIHSGSAAELSYGGFSLTLQNVDADLFDAARDLQFESDRILPSQLVIMDDGVLYGTLSADFLEDGSAGGAIYGYDGNDRLLGWDGDDYLEGGNGSDTLNGGNGNDTIIGGTYADDLRDVVYAGAGDDVIDGGFGNDLLYGQAGNDTITGGWGVDELIGQDGNDVLNGAVYSDLVFGGADDDFVNGGFGHDRINGGSGADVFYHHGSDWIQDYTAADGDVLLFGQPGAEADEFQINYAHTADEFGERSGDDNVAEAFVIYRPTEQIIWALVDGEGQDDILMRIAGDAAVYDLV